jgi:hypothetical protein
MSSEQPEAPSREPIDQIRPDIIKVMAIRAAIQLGVFTPLGDGPLSAEELGRHWAGNTVASNCFCSSWSHLGSWN